MEVTVTAPVEPPPPPPPVTDPTPPVVVPPSPPTPPSGVDTPASGPLTCRDVPYSDRPGCPVTPSSLRRITMNYWDYKGVVRRGRLIVRVDAVKDLSHVFTRGLRPGLPPSGR